MRLIILAAAFCFWMTPSVATAQPDTDTATLNAVLGPAARLTISSASLTFPDADPDTVPVITGVPAAITITAKARATDGGTVTLTVQASDDLRSGLSTIPASAITWTASGAGFVDGTLSAANAQILAAWTGSGVRAGSQSFRFQNLWTHPTGTYTLTITYTLSAA
jgi:hypothetical protein